MAYYIYRVENNQGKGCYQDIGDLFEIISDIINFANTIRRPNPLNDRGIERYPNENEICGFKDREQALKWFSLGQLKLLQEYGYKLVRVKVKIITAFGKTQVLAIK